MLNLHILTGFLGSGKTTLLRRYLTLPEAANTAVIVNEAGEIGLDGALLTEGRGGLQMAMLANGCVCCAQGSELSVTLENLLASVDVPPERIVLETSGLAKPGPVLRSLQTLSALPMRIALHSTFDIPRHRELAETAEAPAQWAAAGTLIPTRADLATQEHQAEALAAAKAINPLAAIVPDLAAAFATRQPPPAIPAEPDTPHPGIATMIARQTGPIAWADLAAWLDNMAGLLGDRLLRTKGVITADDTPTLIQSVGTMFSAPRPFPPHTGEGFLVLIARDTTTADLSRLTPALPLSFAAPNPFAAPRKAPLTAS